MTSDCHASRPGAIEGSAPFPSSGQCLFRPRSPRLEPFSRTRLGERAALVRPLGLAARLKLVKASI